MHSLHEIVESEEEQPNSDDDDEEGKGGGGYDKHKELEKLKERQGARVVGKPKIQIEKFQLAVKLFKGEYFQHDDYNNSFPSSCI